MSKLFDEQTLGTSSFYWWFGQVVDDSTWRANINPTLHEDPLETKGWAYRYKVRIFGNQTANKFTEEGLKEVPDEELVMAELMYPVTAGSGHAGSKQSANIRQGNYVLGFYKDGLDAQQPVILGILSNNDNTILEGQDPEFGYIARTGYAGLSPPVPVAQSDQLLTNDQGSDKPTREGISANIASVADAMQALAGNEAIALNVADKTKETPGLSIQVVLETLVSVLNRVKAALTRGTYFSASTAPLLTLLDNEINKAIQAVASFIKAIISKIRGTVITGLNDSVRQFIDSLLPNERPFLNQILDTATDQISCLINKFIDTLVKLIGEAIKGFLRDAVTVPTCAVEKFANGVISKGLDALSGALNGILGPVNAVISSVTALAEGASGGISIPGIGGGGGNFLSIIAGILQFPLCDNSPESPIITKWSPWGGVRFVDPLSGPLTGLIFGEGVAQCDTGPILAGPTAFVPFGGEPDEPAEFNPIFDVVTGDLVALDIVNQGVGYKSTPKIIKTTPVGGEVVVIPIITDGKITSVSVVDPGGGFLSAPNGTTVTSSNTVFSTPNDTIVKSPAPGPVIPKGTTLDQDLTLNDGAKVPKGTIIESGTELVTPITTTDGDNFIEGQVLEENVSFDFFNEIPEGTIVPAGTVLPYPIEVPSVLDLPNQILDDLLEEQTFSTRLKLNDFSDILDFGFNVYPPNTDLELKEGDEVYLPLNSTSEITDNLGNVVATLKGKGPKVPIMIKSGSSGVLTTPEPITDLVGTELLAGSVGGIPVLIDGTALVTSEGTPIFIGGNGGERVLSGSSVGRTVLLGEDPVVLGGTGGSILQFNGVGLLSGTESIKVGGIGGTPIRVGGNEGSPVTLGSKIFSEKDFTDKIGRYPAVLRIKDVVILKPGINYNKEDKIQISTKSQAVKTSSPSSSVPTLETTTATPNSERSSLTVGGVGGRSVTVGGTGGFILSVGGVPLLIGGSPLKIGGSGGVPLTFGGLPVISGGTGGTPLNTRATGGNPLTLNGTSLTLGGTQLVDDTPLNAVTAGGSGGTALIVGGTGGRPISVNGTLLTAGGLPVSVGGNGGTVVTSGGLPVVANGVGGSLLTVGGLGGTPVVAGGTSFDKDLPVNIGGSGGTTLTVGGIGGTPIVSGGIPLTVDGVPVTVGGTDGIPIGAGGPGGSPVNIGDSPLLGPGGVPVTSGAGGTPLTVGGVAGVPLVFNGFPVVTGDVGESVTVAGVPVTAGGIGGVPVITGGADSGENRGISVTVGGSDGVPVITDGNSNTTPLTNTEDSSNINTIPINVAEASFQPVFDDFGRVIDVKVIDGGIGFTQIPEIFINSRSGINAKLLPVFEVVRIGEDNENSVNIPAGTPIVKVIDCVGKVT